MTRFFFDYRAKDQSLLDYRGQEFHSIQAALEFAQTTAQDLTLSLAENWAGWTVEVSNAQGERYFSVPVDTL
jgi:Domain of unknown function (DUF6894)